MATGAIVGDHRQPPANATAADDLFFKEVMAKHSRLISRIALSFEADPTLRHELIQDILLAVWRALGSYRGQSSLKTFVASIAQKRSISHVTKRAREPRQIALPDDLVSMALRPDEIAMRNDMRNQLVEAIQRLPIPQREAIVLMLEGFSHADIAEVLGISINAATLRCQRAKASLREALGHLS